MRSPGSDKMTPLEKRAGLSLTSIFALRMLGLFLILPVFAEHAKHIPGGNDLTLVGIALGAYGLTQACLQIPFGMASDRYGRKRVIVIGLLLFAAGSLIAAWAPDIQWTIFGRCVQGAGAISAAVTALAADLTSDAHRTKVMAMIGSSIGLVFAGSLIAAPLLYAAIGMGGIFLLTAALALAAIGVVLWVVPAPPPLDLHAHLPKIPFARVLGDAQLLRLNLGIFLLHLIQMSMFVVVPAALIQTGSLPLPEHWKVYLPVVLASFILMVPAIIVAEKKARMKQVFLGAIALLFLSQLGLLLGRDGFGMIVLMLLIFFVAFNILEATLPSLISRIAPPQAKGAALGVYNTTQAFGLFLGGAIGGWLTKHVGPQAVFALAMGLSMIWLLVALSMRAPPVIAMREYAIRPQVDLDGLHARLVGLPGVRDAVVEPNKRMAYLKVNLEGWDERQLRGVLGEAS